MFTYTTIVAGLFFTSLSSCEFAKQNFLPQTQYSDSDFKYCASILVESDNGFSTKLLYFIARTPDNEAEQVFKV